MAITYTPTTNFGAKDSLPTNDPDKVIKGSEFTTEFTALQTAFSLAAPAASPTFTGTVTIPTADINGGNIDGTIIGAATPAAGSFTTGQFGTSLNVDGTVTADGLTVDGSFETNGDIEIKYFGQNTDPSGARYLIFNNTDDTLVAGQPLGGLSWVNNDASSTAGEAAYVKAYAAVNTGKTELRFGTGDQSSPAEAMRIDANGNVGIGTSSPAANHKLNIDQAGYVQALLSTSGTARLSLYGDAAVSAVDAKTNPLALYAGGSERMRIDSSGNLGLGVVPESWATITPIQIKDAAFAGYSAGGAHFAYMGANWYYSGGEKYINNGEASLYSQSNGAHTWYTAPSGTAGNAISFTQAMTLDASGNLLVGKTVTTFNTPGFLYEAGAAVEITTDSNRVMRLNRTTNDGNILEFNKDGGTVGSIGVDSSNDLYINGANNQLKFYINGVNKYLMDDARIYPATDNALDLGIASLRFDDIFATNGTIQTSDRNEKENIRELLEAEARVAQAAKGLLRAFQWKNSVAKKGDDARIHFGIIAQDLQAAFEAEGLDAGRYAMFIHSTWTDEETGEERSRMGVRYSELLAFIIAAL